MNYAPKQTELDQDQRDRLAPLVVLLALFLSVFCAAIVATLPKAGEPTGVVFAPWVSTSDAIARVDAAGGQLIDFGATGNVVIALGPEQGFARGLLRQGAWLVLDGRLAAALCGLDREIV